MAEALAIAGPIIKGVGSFAAANQQSSALKRQATEEENAGAAQSLRIREQARKAIGEQLAGQSSNGFMGGTGSALDAVTESQVNAQMDAMNVIRDAGTKAQADRYEAKMRRTEGMFSLASGLIGGANAAISSGNDWAQAQKGQTPAQAQGSGGGS